MKRAVMIAAALLGLLLPASAAAATNSTVTIDGFNPGMPSKFYGAVKSPKKACKSHRKVTLYHRDSGADTKYGSNKTQPGKGGNYFWEIESNSFPSGKYYARITHENGCAGDTSKFFVLV